jgi:hypothetical protein
LQWCPKLLRSLKPFPTRPSGLHLAGNIKLVPIYHPCTGCGVMLSPMSLLYYQLYECSSYQLYLTYVAGASVRWSHRHDEDTMINQFNRGWCCFKGKPSLMLPSVIMFFTSTSE